MNVNNANFLQILQGQSKTKGASAPVDGEVQASIDSLISKKSEDVSGRSTDFASMLTGENEKLQAQELQSVAEMNEKQSISTVLGNVDKQQVKPEIIIEKDSKQLVNADSLPADILPKNSTSSEALRQAQVKGKIAQNNQQINVAIIPKQESLNINPNIETKVSNLNGKKTYFSHTAKKLFKGAEPSLPTETTVNKENSNLLKLNDFIAKQSPVSQKRSVASAYNPISTSMFNKKVEASLPGVVKSPELDLNRMSAESFGKEDNLLEMGEHSHLHTPHKLDIGAKAVQQQSPVFDLNQLSDNVNTREEVLNKVQDYLVQAKAGSEQKVEFSFQHNELGKVDLMVQKAQGDQLNIAIHSHSVEGAKFFTKHQGELLQSLSQNGVSVSDFKLDSSNTSSQFGHDSGRGQFSQGQRHQQFGSESGQRQHDSEKRQQLWNQLYDKEVA